MKMTNTTTTIEKKSDFTAEELERIDNTIGSGWKLYLSEDSIYAVWISGCKRCGGTGIYSKFHGECYRCTKQGRNPKTREVRKKSIKRLVNQILKIRTETLDQKIKRIAREEKAEAKRIAKLEAEQALLEQQTQQRIAEEKAMRDAEAQAEADKKEKFDALWEKLDCTNRTTVTGKVVYYAWKDSQFGGAYKIIVELENKIRIYGTCPSEASKDDTIQFDCRLSRSDKDADFGFFSRPTKCKILQ
jgi:hypothetical protein|tara:strand:- start:3079 stop:3813 length:735 start_codon:yes stop_codon:yes gene_type:complete